MLNLFDFAKEAGFSKVPIPLRDIVQKFGVDNVRDAIAIHKINDVYRRCCGSASQFGSPLGGVVRRSDGSYVREFQLGALGLQDLAADVKASEPSVATVQLAAVKCFGTDDVVSDEPFVIVSIVSVDVTQQSPTGGALTVRTEIVDNVRGGQVFLDDGRLFTPDGGFRINGTGLHITVSVWDHDVDDADKIRDEIAAILEKAAKEAAKAIVAAAAKEDSSALNGPIGDFSRFEIAGIKPFKLIADGVTKLFGLGDDLVGTHTYQLTADQLVEFSNNPGFRLADGLPTQDSFNVPIPTDFNDSLLRSNDSGGSYKVYLRVRVGKGKPMFVKDPAIVLAK